jgi:citrate lyase subunit beta/citryl-CoA lyase
VPSAGRNGAKIFVRVNTGELLLDDAEAACRAGAFGLFVPKVRAPADLTRIDAHLARLEQEGQRLVLVPMLEDPGAVLDARAIAAASARVFALVTGSEDLATAMGAEPTPEVLRLPKLLVHLAAKAAGVRSFGLLRSVADFRDAEGVKRAAKEARAFGFDGATCVHPSLVPRRRPRRSSARENSLPHSMPRKRPGRGHSCSTARWSTSRSSPAPGRCWREARVPVYDARV